MDMDGQRGLAERAPFHLSRLRIKAAELRKEFWMAWSKARIFFGVTVPGAIDECASSLLDVTGHRARELN
jgi:hypothetical protein